MKQSEYLIGGTHTQTGHDIVVGYTLVFGQLSAAIFEGIHTQVTVETHFVDSVLAFHLAVMARRSRTNQVMNDSHVFQLQFKGSLVVGGVGDQPLGKLRAIVGLYFSDRERRMQYQTDEELFGTVAL